MPRKVVELPSLKILKNMWMWHLGTWLSGTLGGAGLTVGIYYLSGLLPPKGFYDSMKSYSIWTELKAA